MNRYEDAAEALGQSNILQSLKAYSPTVVSTLWVGLDTEESDIDIICQYEDRDRFTRDVEAICSQNPGFEIRCQENHVVACFQLGKFLIEIFATNQAVTEQPGYIHFQVMGRLVKLGGENFQNAIRHLKKQGLKTEPAIAGFLNLTGNPYTAVAALRQCTDSDLIALLEKTNNV